MCSCTTEFGGSTLGAVPRPVGNACNGHGGMHGDSGAVSLLRVSGDDRGQRPGSTDSPTCSGIRVARAAASAMKDLRDLTADSARRTRAVCSGTECMSGSHADGTHALATRRTAAKSPGGADNPCNGHGHCFMGRPYRSCSCTSVYGPNAPRARWVDLPTCDKECPGGHATPCSDHGTCSTTSGDCTCKYGYWGAACDEECPGGAADPCTGHGTCQIDGTCVCSAGYASADCSVECAGGASHPCSGHGVCDDGAAGDGHCTCDSGYFDADCSEVCPGGPATPCFGHGHCFDGSTGNGTCSCDALHCGTDCDQCCSGRWGPDCVNACPGGVDTPCDLHGVCDGTTGQCACFNGWWGGDCSKECPGGHDDPQRPRALR